MENVQRAKRLAEIFGWKRCDCPHDECRDYRFPWGRQELEYVLDDTLILPWLLCELPKRGYEVELASANLLREWIATLTAVDARWMGKNADPLLAICDAVIAAHVVANGDKND